MDHQPPTQIALPLLGPSAAEPRRIVTGTANAEVIAALQRPEDWPFRVAVLTGPPRSGKSLLARWAARQSAAGALALRLSVIDDAERADETALFHAWNAVQQGGAKAGEALLLVLGQTGVETRGERASAAASLGGWRIALPDLASRIGGSLALAIGEPDDAMAAALVEAHAEARGLALPPGAGPYLAARTTRSFAGIEALVAAIDRISLERQTPATMSVLRAALEALHGPDQQRLL